MVRDIRSYDRANPTITPLRKYTGHSSNVGVSTQSTKEWWKELIV